MLVVLVAGDKHVVNHGVIQNKIGLSVQTVGPHVGVDGPVLGLVVLQSVTRPPHRRFSFEVDVGAHRLKPVIDLGDKIGNREVFDVLNCINPHAIQTIGLNPIEGIGDELF